MLKKKILILCTGNSCRSQIAEGFIRKFVNNHAEVYSAGIETHGVNANAINIMQEIGINISAHTSNHVDEYANIEFDYVITVCDNAKESCPIFPSKAIKIHQNFPDPAKVTGTNEEIKNAFRHTRELIEIFSLDFAKKYFSSN